MEWTYYAAYHPPRSSAEHPDTVFRHDLWTPTYR